MQYCDIQHGIFLSDLHLFSPRSHGLHAHQQLVAFQHAHECIVLGGDIFDFRWSTLGGLGPTIDGAIDWITNVLAITGDCQVVFLAGNHDCHPAFQQRLTTLADDAAWAGRFSWHYHHLQLGENLFLHGDILDAGLDVDHLDWYRKRFEHTKPKPAFMHGLYDIVVALRIHQVIPFLRHRPQQTCARIYLAMQQMNLNLPTIKRVYFGHTHIAMQGEPRAGKQFFNPGAAIRHLKLHPHPFTVDR